jgi:hypothetical protein
MHWLQYRLLLSSTALDEGLIEENRGVIPIDLVLGVFYQRLCSQGLGQQTGFRHRQVVGSISAGENLVHNL